MPSLAIDSDRLWADTMTLARIGGLPAGGCDRLALTEADGAARSHDGITVRSFLTSFVVQKATREGAAAIAPAAARLARLEGLEAHALAADFRLEV